MVQAKEFERPWYPVRRRKLSDVSRAQRAEWAADLVRLRPDAEPTVEVYEEYGIARMIRSLDVHGEPVTVVFTRKEWEAITLAALAQFGVSPVRK